MTRADYTCHVMSALDRRSRDVGTGPPVTCRPPDPPPRRHCGQASSFLLSTPEQLDYRSFHGALVSLLRVGGQADLPEREAPLTAAGRANAHYCFSAAWRSGL